MMANLIGFKHDRSEFFIGILARRQKVLLRFRYLVKQTKKAFLLCLMAELILIAEMLRNKEER